MVLKWVKMKVQIPEYCGLLTLRLYCTLQLHMAQCSMPVAHGPMFHASCSLPAPQTQPPSYLKTACFISGQKHELLLLYQVTYG